MSEPRKTIELDIPTTAAERIALEDANRECGCPVCGRLHRKLASNPPIAIAARAIGISHDDLCRLSRAFLREANLHIGTQDYRINEWLKFAIGAAVAKGGSDA